MDALDGLFRRLVLSAQAADALSRALDIGEILDRLAPYKAARRDGLLDTNDDYLHTMMRLVAGERDLVFADDLMQDDLRNELASPNPDVSLLRTYVNTKVRLSSAAVQRVLTGDTSIDLRPPTPTARDAIAPAQRAPGAAPAEAAAAAAAAAAAPAAPPDAAGVPPAVPEPPSAGPGATPVLPVSAVESDEASCPYCAQELPTGRPVRYCPNCGINLRIRRCPGCSTEIESEWKFCVTCGRSAA